MIGALGDVFFDADIARGSDSEHTDPGNLNACITFLADLAAGRRVLECAIGTGRVAQTMNRDF